MQELKTNNNFPNSLCESTKTETLFSRLHPLLHKKITFYKLILFPVVRIYLKHCTESFVWLAMYLMGPSMFIMGQAWSTHFPQKLLFATTLEGP
jgi:hypothetical protein